MITRASVIALCICAAGCAAPRVPQPAPVPQTAAADDKGVLPGTVGALVERTRDGLRVAAVAPDGPGAKAGLRPGDMVVACDGMPIRTVRQFNERVAWARPGTQLHLELTRDARPISIEVEVVQLATAAKL